MKVALVGNMNNNNFSILRYFLDLNVESNLILIEDEIVGDNSHFHPSNDCNDWTVFREYIIFSKLSKKHLILPSFYVKKLFRSYTHIICSGFIPGILSINGIKSSIYYPYGIGVEFVGSKMYLERKRSLAFYKRLVLSFMEHQIIRGISKSKYVFTTELKYTFPVVKSLNNNVLKVDIPMFYHTSDLSAFSEKSDKYILFSHVSHVKIKDKKPMVLCLKELLNRGLAVELWLVDYGRDVHLTKEILKNNNVEDHVKWLAPMKRFEVISLLETKVDFAFSEFDGLMWGGVGFELLATKVPFAHFLENASFQDNHPYFINTRCHVELADAIESDIKNPGTLKKRSDLNNLWFNEKAGIGLAKKWVNYLASI